ncbi:MAG: hypothetical protein Q8Q14_16490, partial [Gemmatimonadales bacterium]|nr:hypothetical protein [Gemmatimonadales bacterium]
GVDRVALARALAQNARQAQANAMAAAALSNPFAYAAQHAAAVALKTRSVQAARSAAFSGFGISAAEDLYIPLHDVAPEHIPGRPLEHPGQGRGVGLARVKEWWATKTPGQKAATVGAGVGLAWMVGLL